MARPIVPGMTPMSRATASVTTQASAATMSSEEVSTTDRRGRAAATATRPVTRPRRRAQRTRPCRRGSARSRGARSATRRPRQPSAWCSPGGRRRRPRTWRRGAAAALDVGPLELERHGRHLPTGVARRSRSPNDLTNTRVRQRRSSRSRGLRTSPPSRHVAPSTTTVRSNLPTPDTPTVRGGADVDGLLVRRLRRRRLHQLHPRRQPTVRTRPPLLDLPPARAADVPSRAAVRRAGNGMARREAPRQRRLRRVARGTTVGGCRAGLGVLAALPPLGLVPAGARRVRPERPDRPGDRRGHQEPGVQGREDTGAAGRAAGATRVAAGLRVLRGIAGGSPSPRVPPEPRPGGALEVLCPGGRPRAGHRRAAGGAGGRCSTGSGAAGVGAYDLPGRLHIRRGVVPRQRAARARASWPPGAAAAGPAAGGGGADGGGAGRPVPLGAARSTSWAPATAHGRRTRTGRSLISRWSWPPRWPLEAA